MRPIDADALKNAFEEDGHMSRYIEEFIDDMPTLDVVPVVHGRWIHCDNGGYYCSNCDRRVAFRFDNSYCPHCGAIMDLK